MNEAATDPHPDPAAATRQRLPSGDSPRALQGVAHVRDGGEQPAELDGRRELAALLDGTDGGSFCLGYDEHAGRMVSPSMADSGGLNNC